jgi:hypothetical protein
LPDEAEEDESFAVMLARTEFADGVNYATYCGARWRLDRRPPGGEVWREHG